MPMTDTSNQQIDSPSSSNGSSNSSIEIQSTISSNRRSQRRRIVKLIFFNIYKFCFFLQ